MQATFFIICAVISTKSITWHRRLQKSLFTFLSHENWWSKMSHESLMTHFAPSVFHFSSLSNLYFITSDIAGISGWRLEPNRATVASENVLPLLVYFPWYDFLSILGTMASGSLGYPSLSLSRSLGGCHTSAPCSSFFQIEHNKLGNVFFWSGGNCCRRPYILDDVVAHCYFCDVIR